MNRPTGQYLIAISCGMGRVVTPVFCKKLHLSVSHSLQGVIDEVIVSFIVHSYTIQSPDYLICLCAQVDGLPSSFSLPSTSGVTKSKLSFSSPDAGVQASFFRACSPSNASTSLRCSVTDILKWF